jgi:uncharacterized RDD family membrane protein YckC
MVDEIAHSPAVTDAIGEQSVGFAEQVAGQVRVRSQRADARVERVARRLLAEAEGSVGEAHAVSARARAAAAEREHGVAREESPPMYAGLVTRALAFAVDAAIVDLTGIFVGVIVGLGLSPPKTPDSIDNLLLAIGGVLFVLWTIAYFVGFWSTTGQTPGNRLMHIRVRRASEDAALRPRWAFVWLIGLGLAALPHLLASGRCC